MQIVVKLFQLCICVFVCVCVCACSCVCGCAFACRCVCARVNVCECKRSVSAYEIVRASANLCGRLLMRGVLVYVRANAYV